MEVLHEGLGDEKYAPCPLLREHVAAGRLGRKSGRASTTTPDGQRRSGLASQVPGLLPEAIMTQIASRVGNAIVPEVQRR